MVFDVTESKVKVTLQTTLRHDGAQPLQFPRWGPRRTNYQNAGGANHGAPLPFSHPHYAMDAERTIHPKVMGKGLNNSGLAVHQDEIINTVVMYVQDSLRNELSYRDIILLVNSTPEAPVKATTSSCHATSSRRSYSYS
ncbi:hypothetical protein PF001_g15080 [Phytophthora fragariae]|nr:hypothetical protein PF001_g15080 [Phytophthora fragariae]